MKTAFIAQVGAVLIASTILALFLVPASLAYKEGGVTSGATAAPACDGVFSSLMVFPSARLKTNANGASTGVEIHVSDATGECSSMIFSSHEVGYISHPAGNQNNHDTVIALR